MSRTYDVIIVGASFAGLAVARELKGRVLVIDRKPIGTGQTSACGTLLEVREDPNVWHERQPNDIIVPRGDIAAELMLAISQSH